jgi:hypothetical protein
VQQVNYDRRATIALLFVLLSAGSVIFISFATLNYLRFYPALSQVQNGVSVDKLTYTTATGATPPTVTIQFTLSNPTDYSGFKVGRATVDTFFFLQNNQNITLFTGSNRLNGSLSVGGQLDPNSVRSVSIPLDLTTQQASDLNMFNSMHSGQVIGEVKLRVDIVTFLVSVTGSVPISGTWDLPLTTA